jgi:RecA/RadA recombinase
MNLRTFGKGQLPFLHPSLGGFALKFGTMSHVYGESGVGKSILALQQAVLALDQGYEVIWVDMNHTFNLKKMLTLNGGKVDFVKYLKLIKLDDISEFKELLENFDGYISANTKLIIIDPITYFYQLHLKKHTEFTCKRELFSIHLPMLARSVLTHDLHAMLVNHVRGDFEKHVRPLGEREINKYCKQVIKLEFDEKRVNHRTITIEQSSRKKFNLKISCKLDRTGFHNFTLLEGNGVRVEDV